MCDVCFRLVSPGVSSLSCLVCNVVVHVSCMQRRPTSSAGLRIQHVHDVSGKTVSSRREKLGKWAGVLSRENGLGLLAPKEQGTDMNKGIAECGNDRGEERWADEHRWLCWHCVEERVAQESYGGASCVHDGSADARARVCVVSMSMHVESPH